MKAHLMYRDRDPVRDFYITPQEQLLIQDLELNTMFRAMAGDDKLMLEVSRKAVLSSLSDPEEILYRQSILKDCIKNPDAVRKLYSIVCEAIEKKRKNWWGISSMFLSSVLSSSISLLQMLTEMLRMIRKVVDENTSRFESEGFQTLFTMLQEELSDEYLAEIEAHLSEMRFRDGIMISAELGDYNQGVHYVPRRQQDKKLRWLRWYFAPSLTISPYDNSGSTDLSKRQDLAINSITNALAQSAEHVLSFFIMLQTELAFYVGCLNLYERLREKGEPVSFPKPTYCHTRRHLFKGLYDVSLALIKEDRVVGNDINADDRDLVIITGANQGGKSTFLRSIGQAQLMMQCGMFVSAESFTANLCDGIFTHFKKEEDAAMKSGKLDEELARMSDIADSIRPDSLILFNESFSATNEREGSEIGRQIVHALLENKIKVFFVSHLYDFSYGLYGQKTDNYLFLRAERQADGSRSFRLVEGEPLKTSFGGDIYRKLLHSRIL
jgi:DNA mismatch repair ATPase MutS